MGGWRRGCQQWQHLTVEQPWSRLRVGHEQRALVSPHRSPCDTVTGQSDRQCLKCLSTWLWMSFKKTGRYRKVEEDERGPPHFSLNVDRSKMSSSQPGLTPFFPFLLSTCLQLSHFSSSRLHAERMSFWALSHLPCLVRTFGIGFDLNQNYRCKRYLRPVFAPKKQNLIKLIEVVLVLITLNHFWTIFEPSLFHLQFENILGSITGSWHNLLLYKKMHNLKKKRKKGTVL